MPLAPKLSDFHYELPDERIALYPLPQRDAAKLLVYDKGTIKHAVFRDIKTYLPPSSILVFNDTRVVHARLLFQRDTGARIEVFCLFPISPHKEMSQAMQVQGSTVWECMAGNQKRWKEQETLSLEFPGKTNLYARLLAKKGKNVEVEFSWEPAHLTWAEVLDKAGKLPLPPYIHREADMQDETEYQTVYARHEGAVAAPTAGLHFTEGLLEELAEKDIQTAKVTLHVGAGTFQPVESEDVLQHPMHNEQVVFDKETIELLRRESARQIVAAGTTSLRALESLYWFGVKLLREPGTEEFFIPKLYPYEATSTCSRKEALQAVLHWMEKKYIAKLWGHTEIFIFPGYKFHLTDALVTNFHQPGSTLLMLIAAFIGDHWKKVYEKALAGDYRFLSYGDASLLVPGNKGS